jgi:hypothetical protein
LLSLLGGVFSAIIKSTFLASALSTWAGVFVSGLIRGLPATIFVFILLFMKKKKKWKVLFPWGYKKELRAELIR